MAMTHISKAIEAAEVDWDHRSESTTREAFERRHVEECDGYPHLIHIDHEGGMIQGGEVFTDYGDTYDLGVGPYPLGSRSLMGVLRNVGNPFRYKTFFEAWVAQDPATLSEKLLAASLNISERQIRNARIMGYMDGYLADRLCCTILRIHPSNLFGTEEWLENDAPGAWPKERRGA